MWQCFVAFIVKRNRAVFCCILSKKKEETGPCFGMLLVKETREFFLGALSEKIQFSDLGRS